MLPNFALGGFDAVRALPGQLRNRTNATIDILIEYAGTVFRPVDAVLPGGGRMVTASTSGGGASPGPKPSGRPKPSGLPRPGSAAFARLTPADVRALEDYTGAKTPGGFREVNGYLRNPSDPKLTAADRARLQARADATSAALEKLPALPGRTYRGVDYGPDVLAKYEKNKIVTEDGFTSTSRNPKVATGGFDGNVIMFVTGHSGRDVAPYAGRYAKQLETLYDKGIRFRVLSKKWDPKLGKWKIDMKEVP